MRLARLLLILAAFTAPLTAVRASAQQASAPVPACNGQYNIVRISDIKPGMMQTFLKAVAAQQAWYRAAGASDQITVERIINRDATTGAESYSETEALTTHTSTPGAKLSPQDDAYKAFVALFQQSSTIKTAYYTCQTKM